MTDDLVLRHNVSDDVSKMMERINQIYLGKSVDMNLFGQDAF